MTFMLFAFVTFDGQVTSISGSFSSELQCKKAAKAIADMLPGHVHYVCVEK
ncbi:MAG: hypothetical protein WBX25_24100 [Rhodomicrobium sp.]